MNSFFEYNNIRIFGILIMVISFVISYIILPKLILVVQYKKLMDDPNDRSSHTQQTPTLGGIAFFVSIIISIFFIKTYDSTNISMNIVAGLTILFIIGLKDDLMVLAPKTKIIAQLAAISFVLFNAEILPENFYGFLGLNEIPLWLSIGFAYFLILSIINAYNLIDGIDGLAAMIGVVIFTVFTFIFYSLQLYFYSFLALIAIGFLLAFLRYNLSNRKKIFMGDTGSMIIGFLIGILSLRFLATEATALQAIHIKPENVFVVVMAVLFVMLLDTVRVVVIRVANHNGAFSADRNHVHHIVIDKGLSHIKASIIISIYSILVTLLFFGLNKVLSANGMFAVMVLLSLITVLILFWLNGNYKALKQKIKIRSFFISTIKPDYSGRVKLRNSLAGFFRIFF